jgi:hypothetical protein
LTLALLGWAASEKCAAGEFRGKRPLPRFLSIVGDATRELVDLTPGPFPKEEGVSAIALRRVRLMREGAGRRSVVGEGKVSGEETSPALAELACPLLG